MRQSATPSRLLIALSVAGALLGALPASAATPNFSSLFVFGDSLSDAAGGNNANPLAPNEGGLAVPGPYVDGHASNGKVAAEYLGNLLGLSDAQQFQFAIAGARTGANGTFPLTGLKTQVNAFAFGGSNAAYGSGLFMVWAGANDLRDALGTADPFSTFAGTLGNLQYAVSTLYALGARNFLLPNSPNLGLTPASQVLGPQASGFASFVTSQFNAQLASLFSPSGSFAASLPGAHLYSYDAFSAHTALFASSSLQPGFNTSNGCLIAVSGAAQAQSACDLSFYVDDIHPTTAVHQILATGMAAAVPEPETMLMMTAGGLALLAMGRRRQA